MWGEWLPELSDLGDTETVNTVGTRLEGSWDYKPKKYECRTENFGPPLLEWWSV